MEIPVLINREVIKSIAGISKEDLNKKDGVRVSQSTSASKTIALAPPSVAQSYSKAKETAFGGGRTTMSATAAAAAPSV